MASEDSELVWKALSDRTRREILDLLRAKPRTTGDLCDHFGKLSRFAVMKHLGVLEAANLIFVEREGRVRWNRLNVVPLQRIYERWVKAYEGVWAERALGLKDHLEKKGTKNE